MHAGRVGKGGVHQLRTEQKVIAKQFADKIDAKYQETHSLRGYARICTGKYHLGR